MNKPENIKSLKVYSFCIKKTTTVLKWVGIYATKIKTGYRQEAIGNRRKKLKMKNINNVFDFIDNVLPLP
jgi:hypothetical protein